MDNLSPTAVWAIFGLLLILIEVFTASFFVLFFGISALLVALFKLFGLSNINLELFLFAAIGFAEIFTFRKKLISSFTTPSQDQSPDTNKEIVLSESVGKGSECKIEYQGTTWTAFNPTDTDMPKGSKVLIAKTDSTKLILKHK